MTTIAISQIVSAINTGQSAEAEKLCRAALLEDQHDENLRLLLAMSLQLQQRPSEALPVFAELTKSFPESSLHWHNYATILADMRFVDEALVAYAKAIALDSVNVSPKIQQGRLLIDRHEYLAAREVLLDAVLLERDSPEVRIIAARACCLCQDVEGAKDLLKRWRTWLPLNDDDVQLDLAQVLILKNDVLEAAALLEDLMVRRPSHVEIKLLLASIYERINRIAEAEAMASQVLFMHELTQSQRNEADHLLAALAIRRKAFSHARELLEQSGPQGLEDFAHYFQLAAACDKLGDSAGAIVALREAHRLEVVERHFDSPEYFGANALALASDAPRVSEKQYLSWPRLVAPDSLDSPIFVMGFPRSGTTLLEQMLDAHPGLQSMDENPFFNSLANKLRHHDSRILEDIGVLRQFDCDELRKRYHALVAERIPRQLNTRLVDKNPLNMQWLPMIYRLFPEAKIILAVRHPCDVVLSCYMQNFRSSSLAAACGTLERLAHAYVQTMVNWLEDVSIFHPSLLVSRYEDLVDDSVLQTSRIATFLELDDASSMLAFDDHARNKGYIGTPSYSQVIEPVNRKGLNRWQKYRQEFEPLLPILEPMLHHWGYLTE